jgi:heparan-alpha-glucosaminide N-acetyltransferase
MMPFPTLEQSVKITGTKPPLSQRIATIDILRALTMVLMIFVNDLGSLRDIPLWLEHVKPGVDGIGLADIVFPAFLFIVGLSLPYAIDNRRKKGDTEWQLVQHVLSRTIALLVMGVFLVNGESRNDEAMGFPPYLWNPLCCISFILIWNVYPPKANRALVYTAKAIGIINLIILAYIYKGEGPNGTITTFAPKWWGILGLIGWSYLAAGLVTIFSKNNIIPIACAWIFFALLSMTFHAGFIPRDSFISFVPNAILGGTLAGLAVGGVLTTLIFRHFKKQNNNVKLTLALLAFAGLLIVLSVLTRPYWKLAKLGATPAWLFLCSAFTILGFVVVYWISDVYRKANLFNFIKPAGTDTLLCYLIPYFLYAIFRAAHLQWPEFIITGGLGLLKSLSLALLCVYITGLLNRAGVKLKL